MGEVFAGRYELVDPIGRGGAGAVWRAWDQRRRRYVAAKVLQQSDAHALLRFVREQAMRIDHPHVLAPASWAADDDKVLFTMDLVHGGSLSHLIGDYGPLPPRYVCVLIDQLLAGLHAVHAEGIIHRDIKPANILLEATGTGTPHVRLSDFGIAMRKGEPRLTEADFVVGTPGYFAPEQMLGAEPDVPADLYAVGLVALYLLGGQRPDSRAIAERFLTEGVPPAPVGVPEPLWQVIAALLQPDPRARFRTATGARKALAGAVELLPEPAPGEEPVEIFDQIGPLPEGFGPDGPLPAGPAPAPEAGPGTAPAAGPATVRPQTPPAPPRQAPEPAYASPTTGYPLAAPAHPPTRTDVPSPAPVPPMPVPQPPVAAAAAAPVAAAPVRARRPGPPASVVVPVLVLAAICFAVGIYALTTG
ncbi:protein kinase [Streptomyces cocklensis]|uniref:non-specific serine/threonine protein kinase n=1 Tax=Actinacidiphila cocklensis TaxID=887465 RepID=A0A9W4DU07_9ACTN|nr:serine/threonine-protein kinase [Actinacidiphila cocklensis]MDD1056963.1 protein kinase [Actinacidiphila cocklensis]CAG6393535.1 putative serine/threonine protein kinase [Actinacidiphila cocklensis]